MATALGMGVLSRLVKKAVTDLFIRSKVRLGIYRPQKGSPSRLYVTVDPRFTIPGVYEMSARDRGTIPRHHAIEEIGRVASSYLDAQKHSAIAAATRVVDAALRSGRARPEGLRKELAQAVSKIIERLEPAVMRIVSSECTAARNLGGLEAITKAGEDRGIKDPVVYFISVNDQYRCKDCTSIHTLDGVVPRVWKLSEVSRSYHVRGEDKPSIFGLHPNCRCELNYLAPGYGFVGGSMVRFVALDHDEFRKQRG